MDARLLLPLLAALGAGCGVVGHVESASTGRATTVVPAVDPVLTVPPTVDQAVRAATDGVLAPGSGDRLLVNVGHDGAGAVSTRVLVVRANGGDRLITGVPGSWKLPEPVPGGPLEGISWSGDTVVLVSTDDSGRFVAVPMTGKPPRTIHPPGRYGYDAISRDGSRLLLVEYADAAGHERYRIRAVDTVTGALDPQVIVDKLEPGEAMVGDPVARATAADFVYTVYERDGKVPFVHALDAMGFYSLCIDLPAEADPVAAKAWHAWPNGTTAVTISNAVTRRTFHLESGRLHPVAYEAAPE